MGGVGGAGQGGGLAVVGGAALMTLDWLTADLARGGTGGTGATGGAGGDGQGGGAYVGAGWLGLHGSLITGNTADGALGGAGSPGPGGAAGQGQQGGVFVAAGAAVKADKYTRSSNNHTGLSDPPPARPAQALKAADDRLRVGGLL
jgi:hypothetical protein